MVLSSDVVRKDYCNKGVNNLPSLVIWLSVTVTRV